MCARGHRAGPHRKRRGPGPRGRRGGTRVAAGAACPPGTTEVRPGSCQAPQMRRRPASSTTGRAPPSSPPSTRAEGEVPRHRRPRPPRQRVDARRHQARRGGDGPAESRRDGGGRERLGRAARADAAGARGQPAQGSLSRDGRRGLPQRRPWLGREGRRAARGRRQGRAPWASARSPRPSASNITQAGRQPAEGGRPGARSAVGGVRAAGRAGVHAHRRAAGVLPAARLHERALARARALPEPPQQPARAGHASSS